MIILGWRELIVGWLLSAIKVDINTICKAIEGMDVNSDGSLDLGELIKGILGLVKSPAPRSAPPKGREPESPR